MARRKREPKPYKNADPTERGVLVVWKPRDEETPEPTNDADEPLTRERERDRPPETT